VVHLEYGEQPLNGTAAVIKFFPGPAAAVRATKQPGIFLNGYSFNITIRIFTAAFILACYILAALLGETNLLASFF